MSKIKDRIDELWEKFSATRDFDVRNELVMSYIHLVKRMVNRIFPKYKYYNEYDDLISCGVLGLIDAVNRFDVSRDIKFETYANLRIRGEIIDHMRKQDPIPSNIRAKLKKIEAAYEELEHKYGRYVTEKEVARYIGISEREVQKILEDSYFFNILYLDEMFEKSNINDILKSGEDIEEECIKQYIRDALAYEIERLPEKERLVINLYYFEELTLKEIALILNLTESRISQIHSKVLVKLRGKIKNLVLK